MHSRGLFTFKAGLSHDTWGVDGLGVLQVYGMFLIYAHTLFRTINKFKLLKQQHFNVSFCFPNADEMFTKFIFHTSMLEKAHSKCLERGGILQKNRKTGEFD